MWVDDFLLAQRARWDEIVHQLNRYNPGDVNAGLRKCGGQDDDIRTITDCLYWNEREHVAEFNEWYSINDRVFALAARALTGLGVRVSLEPLTISPKQLNRLFRVHTAELTEETLIEVIAIKRAAG